MYALQRRGATKAQSSTGRPWRIAAGAHTYGWKYALVLRSSGAAPLWRCAPVAHIWQYTQYYRLAFTHYFPKHRHLAKLVDFPQFLVSSTFIFLYLHNRRPLHGTIHSINSPVSVTFPYLPSLPLRNNHSSSSNLCHLYPSSIHSLLHKTSPFSYVLDL